MRREAYLCYRVGQVEYFQVTSQVKSIERFFKSSQGLKKIFPSQVKSSQDLEKFFQVKSSQVNQV